MANENVGLYGLDIVNGSGGGTAFFFFGGGPRHILRSRKDLTTFCLLAA